MLCNWRIWIHWSQTNQTYFTSALYVHNLLGMSKTKYPFDSNEISIIINFMTSVLYHQRKFCKMESRQIAKDDKLVFGIMIHRWKKSYNHLKIFKEPIWLHLNSQAFKLINWVFVSLTGVTIQERVIFFWVKSF